MSYQRSFCSNGGERGCCIVCYRCPYVTSAGRWNACHGAVVHFAVDSSRRTEYNKIVNFRVTSSPDGKTRLSAWREFLPSKTKWVGVTTRNCRLSRRKGAFLEVRGWFIRRIPSTGLLKMIVGVLTTCHAQYTWDRSICIFLFNRTTLQVFVTYLTGALYVHRLWFYKHQHDNRVRCTQNAFSLPFAAILVNCAPSGEMHNYSTPHIIKENFENLLIHRCNYLLFSQVYYVWQVKTPTVILNNPVLAFVRDHSVQLSLPVRVISACSEGCLMIMVVVLISVLRFPRRSKILCDKFVQYSWPPVGKIEGLHHILDSLWTVLRNIDSVTVCQAANTCPAQ